MTDAQINALRGQDLDVAFAEEVEGYIYRGGKTEKKPWYKGDQPALQRLPSYRDQDAVLRAMASLVSVPPRNAFLDPKGSERFAVAVLLDVRGFQVTLQLLKDGEDDRKKPLSDQLVSSWSAAGESLGDAYVRAMLKAADWFRKERKWRLS